MAAVGGFSAPASAQRLYGTSCPDAKELLELNDLLFSTGFMCTPLDQAFHAAYDTWTQPRGPAPFRDVPAGIAATIQRLSDAGNFDASELQLFQMAPSALRDSVSDALTQSRAGTVEALFLSDDLAGEAFRLGIGFNWTEAEQLLTPLIASAPDDAKLAYRAIVLGAVLGAGERESEPIQSIGWTKLPIWDEAAANNGELKAMLTNLELAVANWGARAVLYLRLGARQLGIPKLNDDLYVDFYADQCRPQPDWPSVATDSLSLVLEMDSGCAAVANLALRDWQSANASDMPAPAWPLDQ